MSVPEFQAVVLAAGRGSRMSDLTANKAKCLLPVGGLPMICYPLSMLQRVGFQDVIVVVQEQSRAEVSLLAKKYGLDLHLDVVSLPPTSGGQQYQEDAGTADALRLVREKLVAPRIMIVSSDLVTDVQIHNLTDLHRVHRATLTALFAKTSFDPKSVPVPGPKVKPKLEQDFVGIDSTNNQICFLSSTADLEEHVALRRSLLQEHPKITLYTKLLDAHFYIMEKWVVDYLAADETISSVKGELFPFLVKKQFQSFKLHNTKADDDTPNAKPGDNHEDILSYYSGDDMAEKAQRLSNWNDHSGDLKDCYHERPLRCYAFVMDSGVCQRANSLHSYCDLNRQASRLLPALAPAREFHQLHATVQRGEKAQIGPECVVGENSQVADKTTIKQSSLGANCRVNEKVRVVNSIVMDNVVFKEGCFVTGSLITDGVTVPEGCEIKDCIVGKGYHLAAGAKHSNEILSKDHEMMEI